MSPSDKHSPANGTNPIPPLAIIGLGGMFPKSPDLEAFWSTIKEGVDAITEIPESHWDPADYFSEDEKKPDFTYAKRGGFLPPHDFEPMKYGLPPNVLEATDATQLLGMVVAEQAMNDAGYGADRDFDRDRVSVILGVTGTLELVIPLGARLGHPLWRKALLEAGLAPGVVDDAVQRIADQYVPWQENSFPGLLGNVVAGRISKYLDTGGTNCVVDAACASSLSALEMGAMELATGKADLVLTGGTDTFNDIFMYMCFSKTPALSPTGDARPFSEGSDGTILGEGLGMVVLKRLADAERDGDKIYAVVKGIGSSSDGKGDAIYAPSSPGQVKALNRAYASAGVTPDTIELLEGHGTGTMRGDAVETEALKEVFGGLEDRAPWCALGSVKSQIGHTKSAAGAAGIIKAALSLSQKVLPPTLKVETPAESVAPGASPFYVNTVKRPWLPHPGHPRRAAVSSFGFGGSNFHVVLEEYQPQKTRPDWDGNVQLFAFSEQNRTALVKRLDSVSHDSDWSTLRAAAKISRETFDATAPCRLLLVVEREQTDLQKLIANAIAMLKTQQEKPSWSTPDGAYYGSESNPGGLAVVFPGQGAQYPGMLRDLACQFPEVLDALAAANDVFPADDSGQRLSDFIYPHPAFDEAATSRHEATLRETQIAQPAIGAVSLGAFKLLETFGLQPNAAAGHSYGELTALCASGRLNVQDFFKASVLRGKLMGGGDGDRGSMLAVRAPLDAVQRIIEEEKLDLVLANKNAPEQAVLSGSSEEIERAAKIFEANEVSVTRLDVAAAFHSSFVADASGPFKEGLDEVPFADAAFPVFANTTGAPYPHEESEARELLASQLAQPVEFVREIEAMYEAGCRTFVEAGPGKRLTGLIRAILGEREHTAVAMDASNGKRSGIADFAQALAQLGAAGHALDLAKWDEGFECPQEEPKGKPRMIVTISGANYRAETSKPKPRPPLQTPQSAAPPAAVPQHSVAPPASATQISSTSPTRTPIQSQPIQATSAHTLRSAPTGDVANLLQQTQANIAALQQMQEQTARLHAQFLQGQEAASKTFHALIQQQQTLFAGGPPISPAALPEVTQTFQPAISPAPVPERPVPDQEPADDGLQAILLAVVAEKTGYPQEMLELDMGLDSDLGIDSIKRVEILSAIQEKVPGLPTLEADELGAIQTLRDIVEKLGAATLASAEEAAATTSQIDPDGLTQLLLDVIAEKTGYPADMLEVDMQLDADLGIDSIKRVEILSAIQEQAPDLPAIEAEEMGALQTIRDVIEALGTASSAPAASGSADGAADRLGPILLSVISDKTGYPEEMLEMHMSLDADLGIDSIKRVEILSAIQELMPDLPSIEAEEMGKLVTLQDVVDALRATPSSAPEPPAQVASMTPTRSGGDIQRSVLRLVPLPQTDSRKAIRLPEGARLLVVTGEAPIADDVIRLLNAKGFDAARAGFSAEIKIPEDLSGLLILAPLNSEDGTFLKQAFAYTQAAAGKLREAAQRSGALLATVARLDGGFGLRAPSAIANPLSGGLAGLTKTAALEWPDVTCRAFDISTELEDADAAAALVDELFHAGPAEVGFSTDGLQTLELVDAPLSAPSGDLPLSSEDVIVVSGGARGVTATISTALARAAQPTLILLGRSPAPGPEEVWARPLRSEAEIKSALLHRADEKVAPRELENRFRSFTANREMNETMEAIAQTGATVAYRQVDIRDEKAVEDVLNAVRNEFGPITGLVHGAGVLADRRIEDKTGEQFDGVFDTKVAGLINLLFATRTDPLTIMVLFSSSTARFGRTGQVDYAMANEVLNKIAQLEAAGRPECRVLSLNWGPWAGGMVTPSLRGVFEKEGIGLIGLEQGAEYLLRELSAPGDSPVEVIVMGPGSRVGSVAVSTPHEEPLNSVLSLDVDVERFPFLASHVIDGKAVVPVAMYLEWFAHAALHDQPGLRFLGIEDLRVLKGVILESGTPTSLEFLTRKAVERDGMQVVSVELRSHPASGAPLLHATAQVLLGSQFAESTPALDTLELPPYSGIQDEIYNNRLLFHGDDFQGITSVDGCSEEGIAVSTRSAPNPSRWIREPLRRRWIADPLALDCAFQALILWSFAQRDTGSLPIRLGRYEQFRTAFPKGGVHITARIVHATEHNAHATIEFIDPKDNTLVARIDDYECVIDASLNQAFQRNSLAHESVGG